MTKGLGVIAGCLGVLLLIGLVLFGWYAGTYNTLNTKLQAVDGAKSHYGAALDTCTQKIKGVWTIANQYLEHESSTFQGVAQARSGYDKAAEMYEKIAANPNASQDQLTQAGSGVYQAALQFRIQVEAYPQLKGSETSKQSMASLEVSVNEIKTALDDWIQGIKDYNTFRGSLGPSIIGGLMPRFPAKIDYYEGKTESLDMDSLNPQKK